MKLIRNKKVKNSNTNIMQYKEKFYLENELEEQRGYWGAFLFLFFCYCFFLFFPFYLIQNDLVLSWLNFILSDLVQNGVALTKSLKRKRENLARRCCSLQHNLILEFWYTTGGHSSRAIQGFQGSISAVAMGFSCIGGLVDHLCPNMDSPLRVGNCNN